MATDEDWADVARGARDALSSLGYPPVPPCLPGEAEECGGSFAQHATAYFGTIKAVADHQLGHLGELGQMHGEFYWKARENLARDCKNAHA